MSQSQEVSVERLITVIQRIQQGRMSGILTARRGDGVTAEEGTVDFAKGQIRQVKVGRRSGPDALNWLSTWSNCHCSFSSSIHTDVDSFLRIFLSSEGKRPTPIPEQLLTPRPELSPWRTDALGQPTNSTQAIPSRGNIPSDQSFSPDSLAHLIPQQAYPPHETLRFLDSQGLTRTHRHLLLLIDGHRSIAELIRIINRPESEVIHLLRDLENATIIRMTRS